MPTAQKAEHHRRHVECCGASENNLSSHIGLKTHSLTTFHQSDFLTGRGVAEMYYDILSGKDYWQ